MAHILVIDGEQDVRKIIGFLLREAGECVVATASNTERLDSVQMGPVDLIICDLGFINAADLAYAVSLQRLFPGAKIIGTSAAIPGTAPDRLADLANQAGLVGILSKPFLIEDLLKAVRRALQQEP